MAPLSSIHSHFTTIFFITCFYSLVHFSSCTITTTMTKTPFPNEILSLDIATMLRTDLDATQSASMDYGNLVHEQPAGVFYPSSVDDIIDLIKLSNNRSNPFTIAPKGCGHSVRGQAMARNGVVVEMSSLNKNGVGVRVSWNPSLGYFADVGGEQLWIDVLNSTLEHGLAPVSWTDYLYLSVGGTLSNAGISGQSFLHGPQISNVYELDVVTGKGELVTCSKHMNSEIFFAVLGGLGQFGIITRARIVLHKAPTRAKWVRLVYNDFSTFTRDQEHLISMETNLPDYVEGSIITDQSPPNNWRSSFYSSSHQSKINALLRNNQGLLYTIELVKYYDPQTADTIDQDLEELLDDLNFLPGFVFKRDVPLVDFLNRVGSRGNSNSHNSAGKMESHPWLNLFVPRSRIQDFNRGVFFDKIRHHNHTSGPILFYPLKTSKWDDRMSAVTPEAEGEEIFYTMALLHTSGTSDEADILDNLCNEIIDFCEKAGIKMKQYIPHYTTKEDWKKHFGSKWNMFQDRKTRMDPRMILSPGQRIFNPVISIPQGQK